MKNFPDLFSHQFLDSLNIHFTNQATLHTVDHSEFIQAET